MSRTLRPQQITSVTVDYVYICFDRSRPFKVMDFAQVETQIESHEKNNDCNQ